MMQINWPLVIVLFFLSIPGVLIAIPRLIKLFLPNNTPALQNRMARLAVGQTLVMVFVMALAGDVLSKRTGLNAPILSNLLQAKPVFVQIQSMFLPVILATVIGLIVFLILYYGLVSFFLDKKTLSLMYNMRKALALDGCLLYGGVVEEILARWGLVNLLSFFGLLFLGQLTAVNIWVAIILSAVLTAVGQLPAYLAAGCQASRQFVYSLILLNCWQAILFGGLFWRFGLVAAIFSHMLFHLGWFLYDRT